MGTAPSLHPPAPPRSSRRQRRRFKQKKKKLSPWPGASVPAPSLPRCSQGKTTAHFSLRPARAPCFPAVREPSPAGGGVEQAGRPAFLPSLLLFASTCCGLLAPTSVWGLRRPRARFVAGLFPGPWKFLGSPLSSLYLLGSPGTPPVPAVPSLRTSSVPRLRDPLYPLPGFLACCLPWAPGP